MTIARWKVRFPRWPPKGCSPVTPIEPWGKQFFVYNAPKDVEIRGDPRCPPLDDVRPQWLRDEIAASLLQEGQCLADIEEPRAKAEVEHRQDAAAADDAPASETVLCATDFRQRPLMHLRPEEWRDLLAALPELRAELRRTQAEVDALDERGTIEQDFWKRREFIPDKYEEKNIGRMHNRRIFQRGKIGPKARERRTATTTDELERIAQRGRDE